MVCTPAVGDGADGGGYGDGLGSGGGRWHRANAT